MIGIAEILGIISIVVSIVLGTHIAVHSKCFGCFSIDTSGNEIDIKIGSVEAQVSQTEVKLDYIDASGCLVEVADIPIKR